MTVLGMSCAGCGFAFPSQPATAIELLATMPDTYEAIVAPSSGGAVGERFLHLRTVRSTWSPVELLAHVTAGVVAAERALLAPASPDRTAPVVIEAPLVHDDERAVADALAGLRAAVGALVATASSVVRAGAADPFAVHVLARVAHECVHHSLDIAAAVDHGPARIMTAVQPIATRVG